MCEHDIQFYNSYCHNNSLFLSKAIETVLVILGTLCHSCYKWLMYKCMTLNDKTDNNGSNFVYITI
jgi:hypothetical protein